MSLGGMAVRGALPPEGESFLHTQMLNFKDLFIDHALHSVLELLYLLYCLCIINV